MLDYHFGYTASGQARRGKRVRPRLVLAVAQEAGAPPEDALDAAVAVELLHNYSLIHDDIEDGDRLRHGRDTLWAKYGMPQALNAGDALCALSFLALGNARARHPAARVNLMVERLHAAHLEMCKGQSLDMAFEAESVIEPGRYLEMIAGKTSALFAVSCELGALCGGSSEADVERYRELGTAFGMAFQMYDDVLGVWAEVEATGKTRGADVQRRKKSYPVVWALQHGQGAPREIVARAFSDRGEMEPATRDAVIEALEQLGAREAALRSAAKHLAVVERAPHGAVRDFLLSLLPVAPEETVRK
jgi:geranylgeranyl diphosphate synthase type I